jgi:endonuclease/exonuclease/phosphatase family metal-dependent hydrolase
MSLVLHVGAYNHLTGGVDLDSSGSKRLDRLDRQLDLLAPLGLDVLISTEAKGWFDQRDSAALELARSRLGMRPVWVLAPRHGCHIVLWINPERLHDPQERHETAHPFWHAQARVSVRVDGLAERLWLFGAHFSPFVPSIRVQEAYATANLADGRLVLGGGDFNDDGLTDPIPDRGGMPAYKRLRHQRAGGESAAGVLAAAELVDVAAALNPDGPREPTAGFKDQAPLRCDRLYVCKRLRESPREYARLPYDPELSDHCAVHAWFDLAAAL